MIIKDNEITIRSAVENDAADLCRWWNDGKVMAHAGFPNGLNTTRDKIVELIKGNKDSKQRLIIVINNLNVGEMSYTILDNTAEIGIKICEFEYQGNGNGTRALKLLIRYLFEELKVDKIILDTNLKNERAKHVYEKIGFSKVRINYNSWQDQLGNWQDSIDYQFKKEDWITKKL